MDSMDWYYEFSPDQPSVQNVLSPSFLEPTFDFGHEASTGIENHSAFEQPLNTVDQATGYCDWSSVAQPQEQQPNWANRGSNQQTENACCDSTQEPDPSANSMSMRELVDIEIERAMERVLEENVPAENADQQQPPPPLVKRSSRRRRGPPDDQPEYTHRCEPCNRTFKSLGYKKQHAHWYHGAVRPRFRCDVCGKFYATAEQRDGHALRHVPDNKPHRCSACGATYVNDYDLNAHVRRKHLAQKPYQCALGCGGRFVRNDQKLMHEKRNNCGKRRPRLFESYRS